MACWKGVISTSMVLWPWELWSHILLVNLDGPTWGSFGNYKKTPKSIFYQVMMHGFDCIPSSIYEGQQDLINRINFRWSPLQQDWYKLNTDGTFHEPLRVGGVGFLLLRDTIALFAGDKDVEGKGSFLAKGCCCVRSEEWGKWKWRHVEGKWYLISSITKR